MNGAGCCFPPPGPFGCGSIGPGFGFGGFWIALFVIAIIFFSFFSFGIWGLGGFC